MGKKHTTRRGMLGTLLGLGTATVLNGALDSSAWRAYESIEESWIRGRHGLLLRQFPSISGAAQLDLELKLAELHRRAMRFQYLVKRQPQLLRGGIWQLSSLPWDEKNSTTLSVGDAGYRRHEHYMRSLNQALKQHPDYQLYRQAQMRLWKTPEYRDGHRQYSDRMQDLQNLYGGTGGVITAAGN